MRMWSLIKWALLLAAIFPLTGCFMISARVSEIGEREYAGECKGLEQQTIQLDLFDIETKDGPGDPWKVTYHPQWPFAHHGHGRLLGHVSGTVISRTAVPYQEPMRRPGSSYNDPFWAEGTVTIDVEGDRLLFEYIKIGNLSRSDKDSVPTFEVRKRFRRWYGYPSQIVLPATMAVDLGIDIIIAPLQVMILCMFG